MKTFLWAVAALFVAQAAPSPYPPFPHGPPGPSDGWTCVDKYDEWLGFHKVCTRVDPKR